MSGKHLNIEAADEGRKIDWPILPVRLPPRVYEALVERARADGEKPGPWAREQLSALFPQAA